MPECVDWCRLVGWVAAKEQVLSGNKAIGRHPDTRGVLINYVVAARGLSRY